MALGGLALSKPNFPSRKSSASEGKRLQAALLYHGRAISMFSRQMATNVFDPRSVLILTILFAIFELLHENTSAAGAVIARGFRLLTSHFAKAERSPVSTKIHTYPSSGLENMGDLKHIWLRLPCMDCLLPFVPPDVKSDMVQGTNWMPSLPSWDSSIDTIYRSWREAYVQHLQVKTHAHGCKPEATQLDLRSTELIKTYHSWSDVLKRRIETEKDPVILRSLRLMRVEQFNLLIFGNDSHRTLSSDAFKDLVLYCDNLLAETKRHPLKTRMSTYSRVSPLLFGIIQRCVYLDVQKLAIATVEKYYPAGVNSRIMLSK